MLLTIEKVAYLRQVDIFAGTPDFVLAAVAQIAEEISLDDGETFIEEGAVEDTMYVIVEGEVRVHAGDQTLITLGPGDSVGELAVLDPEPRAASASAAGEALLFRLGKAAFDDVMVDRPEIAQGVIHALVRRVRAHARFLREQQPA
jgi:CRP-like cAMP-binding protein